MCVLIVRYINIVCAYEQLFKYLIFLYFIFREIYLLGNMYKINYQKQLSICILHK